MTTSQTKTTRANLEILSNLAFDARDGGSWGHVELAVDLAGEVLVEQHLELPVLRLLRNKHVDRERESARARARKRERERERSKDVHGFRNENL
jgi:hypothetical protein